MARTKSSRGKEPFQMRSGNNAETGTPYPFLKGLKNIGKKIMGATPIGMAAKALKGGNDPSSAAATAMGGADDVNTKIDEIHSALVGGEEEGGGDTMMTKKTTGPFYHDEHKGQSDPKHLMHTHHPKSPNHPDNLPKYYIEGEKGPVSAEHFQGNNSGMGRENTPTRYKK